MKYSKSAAAVFGLLVAAVALSAPPSSRYLPAGFVRPVKAVSVAFPQGWAFFTKDPTEANDAAYVRHGGKWVPIVEALPLIDAAGVSRQARAIDAEVAALAAASDEAFVSCAAGADLQRCAADAPMVNRPFKQSDPPLCGPVLIRRIEPIPFAYGTRVVSMPSKVVIAHAECSA
jgi:hypothetical protein